jgi:hypothetical protein
VLALAVFLLLPAPARAATGLTWSAAIPVDRHAAGVGMTGVACPAATQCTAIDQQGKEVTFNPEAPANVTALSISGAIPTSVACPSAVQCTAVDSRGVEATFNPQTAGLIKSAAVDSQGVPISVDCPTTVQCTAVDLSGNEASFNPATGAPVGKKSPDPIDSGRTLVAVDCTGQTMCTAVDNGSVNAGPTGITFDPTQSQVTGETTVEGGSTSSVGPVALVCQSSSSNCLALDSGGSLVEFGPSVNSTTTIDSGPTPTALACASDSACVAVDASGNEVSINLGPNGLNTNGVQPVDRGRVLTGVSCPTSRQCTAVDSSGGEVTFDPDNPPSTPAPVPVDGTTRFTALACPSTEQCTAMDARGLEATFAPGSGAVLGAVAVDPGTTGIYSVGCAGATQCTAVDNDGNEVTFNPASPGGATPLSLDPGHALFGVACPLPGQCTTVDDHGAEITFNPQAPGKPSPVTLDPGHALLGLSCPTATQCTAIDDAGSELTFNPQSPSAHRSSAVDPRLDSAISCPDTNDCVAVGAAGNDVAFNPNAVIPWTATVATGDQLTAIACRTDHDCVAVSSGGAVLEGDPWGAAPWTPQQLTAGIAAGGLACPSASRCVAADASGDSFVGVGGPLPPIPVGASGPSISGRAIEGQRLTETHGGWSQGPTSYAYQWLRCNSAGRVCAPIAGATAQAYTVTRADVGHALRVEEWAADISGAAAAPSTSAGTPIVRPLVPVRASGAALALHALHPRLRFTLAAFIGDPPISKITISLTSGFGFARKALRGLSIKTPSPKTRFSATVHRGSMEVRLRNPSARVRVGIGGGLLVAPRRLIRHGRSQIHGKKTQVGVTVIERGGTRTRLTLELPL